MLWLVGHRDREKLAANVALQTSLGSTVELVEPKALTGLVPGIAVDDLGGAAYEPMGGTAIGSEAMVSITHRVISEGIELRTHTAVVRLLTSDARVTGVRTVDGRISAQTVVLAAGAW